MRVRAEMATAISGPVSHDLIDQLIGTDKPVCVKILKLRDEMEEVDHIAKVALNFPPDPNLKFRVADLGQITKPELQHLPQNPKFWTICIETVCKLAGMNDRQAATFGTCMVETACQMAGMETAEASVLQVIHPLLADAPVEVGQVDPRALWVILTDAWENFGPEPWMRRTFHYMLTFTASDADFHLHSMEERFPIVELLEQSADIREDPAFSRLL